MRETFTRLKSVLRTFFGRSNAGESDEKYRYSPEVAKRAENGDPVAQAHLATSYHEGLGVGQNPDLAIHWWSAAAKQGHSGSQLMLAVSYDVGKVMPLDLIEAGYWAARSKDAGNELGALFLDSVVRKLGVDGSSRLIATLRERHPNLTSDEIELLMSPLAEPQP